MVIAWMGNPASLCGRNFRWYQKAVGQTEVCTGLFAYGLVYWPFGACASGYRIRELTCSVMLATHRQKYPNLTFCNKLPAPKVFKPGNKSHSYYGDIERGVVTWLSSCWHLGESSAEGSCLGVCLGAVWCARTCRMGLQLLG